jgi:DNA topoisomerase-1
VRSGRFGPYIQLGEATEGEKPKRASLPKGLSTDDVDLDRALGLLSLPREIGKHPDDGEPIVAGVGRFGPYVQHGKTYANLTTGDDVLTVGLNRAVTLIEEKRAKRAQKGGRRGGDPGRALGDHPDKGGPIVVKNGRYGPYANHDGVNATLPSHLTPETITLEEAVGLIEARSARGGKKPAAKPRAAAPKAASKPKAAAKPRAAASKAASKPKAAAKPKPPARASKEPPRKSGDQ